MALSAAAKQMAASFGYQTIAPKKVVVGPQNIGIVGGGVGGNSNPNGYVPPPVAAPAAPPPPPEPAPAPPPPPPPPPDWKTLVEQDPNAALERGYLNTQNTITTDALRKAWLQHTQSTSDAFNAHGGLFSGAAANAQKIGEADYGEQLKQQALNYDKGGHDINMSTLARLMKNFADTGVAS